MKIKVVIQKYNSAACEEIYEWLAENNLSWRHGVSLQPIAVGRNQNVMRFLAEDVPQGFTHLLMLDDDMVPVEETTPILTSEEPLIYCAYPNSRGGIDHYGDDTLCCGCIRISAEALKKIPSPWFKTGHNADLTKYMGCDCNHMARIAAESEIKPKMVGYIGHMQRMVFAIDPKSEGKKMMWFGRGVRKITMEANK
jgi:hypothetical protein